MRAAWKSDQGLVRENNEDFVLADEENGIFMLADGMGGGPAGEVASELAVTAAHELLLKELPGTQYADPRRLLAEALAAAHSAVAKRALAEPNLHGMGTTLEMVLVRDSEAVACHVGDSRIYKFRQGTLRRITTDDNYAAMLAEVGDLPLEEIPSAYSHLLTQAVGVSEQLVPELHILELKPGDLILICSDGLTGSISDKEIQALIEEKKGELQKITEALVAAANERGGMDNVSVLLLEAVPAVAAGTLPVPS